MKLRGDDFFRDIDNFIFIDGYNFFEMLRRSERIRPAEDPPRKEQEQRVVRERDILAILSRTEHRR